MTSIIHSPVQSVADLRFHPMPQNKKLAITHACRSGGVFVFVDTKGKVYSSQVQNNDQVQP